MRDRWLASLDSADPADWVTIAAYAVAAMLCVLAGFRARSGGQQGEQRFWWFTTLALIAMGINEFLDLQTLLTIVVRDHAKAHGWYGAHRPIQVAFIVGLTAAAAIAGAIVLWLTRRMAGTIRIAILGLAFIALFILIRAASFHHMDRFLGGGWPAFNWGSVQELAGIVVVALAALLYRKKEGQAE
ncbi:MAG: hypothetical protein WA948_01755 [Pontixanthobacter sp.]